MTEKNVTFKLRLDADPNAGSAVKNVRDQVKETNEELERLKKESTDAKLQMGEAFKTGVQGSLQLAKGVAFMAASSEEDFEKMARMLVKIEAGFQAITGVIDLTKGIVEGFRAWRTATQAAAASNAVLTASNEALAASQAKVAATQVAGGVAGGAARGAAGSLAGQGLATAAGAGAFGTFKAIGGRIAGIGSAAAPYAVGALKATGVVGAGIALGEGINYLRTGETASGAIFGEDGYFAARRGRIESAERVQRMQEVSESRRLQRQRGLSARLQEEAAQRAAVRDVRTQIAVTGLNPLESAREREGILRSALSTNRGSLQDVRAERQLAEQALANESTEAGRDIQNNSRLKLLKREKALLEEQKNLKGQIANTEKEQLGLLKDELETVRQQISAQESANRSDVETFGRLSAADQRKAAEAITAINADPNDVKAARTLERLGLGRGVTSGAFSARGEAALRRQGFDPEALFKQRQEKLQEDRQRAAELQDQVEEQATESKEAMIAFLEVMSETLPEITKKLEDFQERLENDRATREVGSS